MRDALSAQPHTAETFFVYLALRGAATRYRLPHLVLVRQAQLSPLVSPVFHCNVTTACPLRASLRGAQPLPLHVILRVGYPNIDPAFRLY